MIAFPVSAYFIRAVGFYPAGGLNLFARAEFTGLWHAVTQDCAKSGSHGCPGLKQTGPPFGGPVSCGTPYIAGDSGVLKKDTFINAPTYRQIKVAAR